MHNIRFVKMVASGNDFVIAEMKRMRADTIRTIARALCQRKTGIGSDGLLILEPSTHADIRMRIFNADGSEAEMCGNGARCVGLYMHRFHRRKSLFTIESKAGIINAEVCNDSVRIKLTDPLALAQDVLLSLQKKLNINYINTGVPHVVIFVEGLDAIDVEVIGRQVRYHRKFAPAGANVDFVEVAGPSQIKVRTYERGVEGETLACGTGSVASALIFAMKTGAKNKVYVHTRSGELLTVFFENKKGCFRNVWLKGKAMIVFSGTSFI
ncbi:MAG: diaminopimelate epimerase [Candidatus Omnitrophota bacterium]|nr:MAG: diaminopimelate epimerase [Candidatus Omnitrophota bacterium]